MKGSISIILGIRKHLITINLKHFFRNIPFSNRGLFAPSKDFPRLPGSDEDDDNNDDDDDDDNNDDDDYDDDDDDDNDDDDNDNDDQCGQRGSSRIVGGGEAAVGEFPWQVVLRG